MVTHEVGMQPDIVEYLGGHLLDKQGTMDLRTNVSRWKTQVVVPAIRRAEQQGFCEQPPALTPDGLIPYAELVPLRRLASKEI